MTGYAARAKSNARMSVRTAEIIRTLLAPTKRHPGMEHCSAVAWRIVSRGAARLNGSYFPRAAARLDSACVAYAGTLHCEVSRNSKRQRKGIREYTEPCSGDSRSAILAVEP
jgi:hypothetical protein